MCIFVWQFAKILRVQFPEPSITEFFRKLVRDVISQRKETGVSRKDFMQLLIELKERGSLATEHEEDRVEAEKLAGNHVASDKTSEQGALGPDSLTKHSKVKIRGRGASK